MRNHFTGATIGEAVSEALTSLLHDPEPDAVLNIESHLFNVTIEADRCEYDLDIGRELWLNRSRWSRLTREYVPSDALEQFISQANEILNGDARLGATANMMFHDPKRYDKKHRWGGCLMGATFRGDNKKSGPATLTFFSRTSYIGYMGFMDAAIACVLARHIREGERIAFRWHLSSMQLHCFKTLPYVFSQPDLMKQLEFNARALRSGKRRKMSPTERNMAKWYNKILEAFDEYGTDMLDHEKYGPFKRIKRRWLEHKGHSEKAPPPSLKLDKLDFTKCVPGKGTIGGD